jgi:hypothetical protein
MLMHNDSGLYLRHGGAERLWAAAAAAAATMDRGKRWRDRTGAYGRGAAGEYTGDGERVSGTSSDAGTAEGGGPA